MVDLGVVIIEFDSRLVRSPIIGRQERSGDDELAGVGFRGAVSPDISTTRASPDRLSLLGTLHSLY